MDYYAVTVQKLIEEFRKMPGVGSKSAQRMAFYVLGLSEEKAHGTIRFSFGKENTIEEVDYVVDTLKNTIQRLREMSPLFNLKGEIKNV